MRDAYRLLFLLLLWTAGNAARADDADCDPAQHPLNPQEQAFYGHFPALRDSLPKPTAGFQLDPASKKLFTPEYPYVPASECGLTYSSLSVSVTYLRSELTAPKPAAPDTDKQKQIQELQVQEEKLAQKMLEANQAGDFERIGDIGAEKRRLDQQLDALQGIPPENAQLTRGSGGSVSLVLNDASQESCYGSPRVMPVAGATAYRCIGGSAADKTGVHLLVVFGKASTQQDVDSVTLTPALDNARAQQMQEITIIVDSDDAALADALYNQIDMDALRKLLEQ